MAAQLCYREAILHNSSTWVKITGGKRREKSLQEQLEALLTIHMPVKLEGMTTTADALLSTESGLLALFYF